MRIEESVNLPDAKVAQPVLTTGTALVLYVALFRLALFVYAAPNYGTLAMNSITSPVANTRLGAT